MSNYNAGYDFEPNDSVWVVNRTLQSVNHGTCIQVDIKIYPDSAYVPVPTPVYGTTPTPSPQVPIVDHLIYWVILDNGVGSVKVVDGDIFATLSEALMALGSDITPTPTPTPSITTSITPTQTPTPTITATSGTTPTVTPTLTPSPTTTVTVSPTVSQSATFVPSQTPTVTPTITPSNSVLLSVLVTGAGEGSVDGVYTYTGFNHNGHPVFYFNGIADNIQQIVYLSYNNNWCIIDSGNTPAYYSASQNISFPWQTSWVTNFGAAPAPTVNSELTPITPTPSPTASHTPTPTVTPTPS